MRGGKNISDLWATKDGSEVDEAAKTVAEEVLLLLYSQCAKRFEPAEQNEFKKSSSIYGYVLANAIGRIWADAAVGAQLEMNPTGENAELIESNKEAITKSIAAFIAHQVNQSACIQARIISVNEQGMADYARSEKGMGNGSNPKADR